MRRRAHLSTPVTADPGSALEQLRAFARQHRQGLNPNPVPQQARHAALVRDEAGNLAIQRFHEARAAMEAARARELLDPALHPDAPRVQWVATDAEKRELQADFSDKHAWTPQKLARRIGVTPRAINMRCEAGELPCIDNGTSKRARRQIPVSVVKLVIRYGLRAVAYMTKAGQLTRA